VSRLKERGFLAPLRAFTRAPGSHAAFSPFSAVRPAETTPVITASLSRAKAEHGKDAGRENGSAIRATEDAARRMRARACKRRIRVFSRGGRVAKHLGLTAARGGRGAPEGTQSAATVKAYRGRTSWRAGGLVFALLGVLLLTTPASASAAGHPFLGTFCEPTGLGSAPCEPSFLKPQGLAVDQSSGDLLVIDAGVRG
jgi:hypothetical protein